MLTNQPVVELMSYKMSSEDIYNENPLNKEFYEENANYVCDISSMIITTESEALKNEEKPNELEEAMDIYFRNELEVKETPLNYNEIRIYQGVEEQKATELIESNGSNNGKLMETQNINQLRLAFGVLMRLVWPFANGVARRIYNIRDVRFFRLLNGIASSRQALTNLIAFAANTISMNLSSVQVSHRIEPILRLMKIRKLRRDLQSISNSPTSSPDHPILNFALYMRNPKGSTLPNFGMPTVPEKPAPKCCSLEILAQPPQSQPILADIIFIHGLHGSLANTWKQGLWKNERPPVQFQRPPKPPVRPPKRSRNSRTTCVRAPHKQKRARFERLDELYRSSFDHETNDKMTEQSMNEKFAYLLDEAGDINVCDSLVHNFPTFRIRLNDDGRLLSAEIETVIKSDTSSNQNNRNSNYNNDAKDSNSSSIAKQNYSFYSKCWPRDWLPLDCPGVRVIVVNYTTDQYLWRPVWKQKESRTNLIQRAREMAELLTEQNVGNGRPIVWVGHSKGGLFIKEIIVDAWESGRPATAPLWRSTKGCFFYSVPHRGSNLALIKAPLLKRSVELMELEKNNKYLLDLHRRFAGLYYLGHLKAEVFSFVETAMTFMAVLYLRIVGVDSADPGFGNVCGIRLDHREICKPRSRNCILYKELVKMINNILKS